jgi:Winged helix DNA-binding domain
MSAVGGARGRSASAGPLISRDDILAYRRRVQALEERLPPGAASLCQAAWAGLQDSMPRAALLSIAARVEETRSDVLDDPALVQVWGPRYSTYVVAVEDVAVFTLGRLPDRGVRRSRAEDIAARLSAFLDGRELPMGEAGRALGVHPSSLRYAAPTGRVLIHWDGARQPTVRIAPPPSMDAADARLELARRHLRVFGPTTAVALADWAGITRAEAADAFAALRAELLAVRTPVGDAWILAEDEEHLRAPAGQPAGARLLPSGDAFFLLQGLERELLVSDPRLRSNLWTSRVWPGAVLVDGELAGTWRRAGVTVDVEPWRALSGAERHAVEAEAAALPLPGAGSAIAVRWGRGSVGSGRSG